MIKVTTADEELERLIEEEKTLQSDKEDKV